MNENNKGINGTSSESGGKLLRGATTLAVAGIIAKVLGAAFRIPLTNLIGAIGMSYYGVAYPIYAFFLFIATAGLPVAISKMVSERIAVDQYAGAYRAFKISFYIMSVLGLLSFSICFFGADFLADLMGNPGAAASVRAISPALLFAPVVSSFRGYFQGQQNMMPTAKSEITEQLFRVIVGLGMSFALVSKSVQLASAGATLGASAGSFAALILIVVIFLLNKKERHIRIDTDMHPRESRRSVIKEILAISVPVTIGSAIMPIMLLIDSSLIMNRLLATGWDNDTAKTLYGLISGFCDPLIGVPQIFTIAVAASLVPAVSEAFTKNNKENLDKNIQLSMRAMMIITMPCALGMMVLAKPILTLLYPMQYESALRAVPILQILCFGIIGLSILRTFSSALQGVGKMNSPVINLGIGAVFKLVITYVLVGIPFFNVNGAAIGSVTAYAVASILNYKSMKKYIGTEIHFRKTFFKPLLASLIMGAAAAAVYKIMMAMSGHNSIAVFAAIIVGAMVYFVMIFVTKSIEREEVLKFPKGNLIVKMSDKLHLTKEEI